MGLRETRRGGRNTPSPRLSSAIDGIDQIDEAAATCAHVSDGRWSMDFWARSNLLAQTFLIYSDTPTVTTVCTLVGHYFSSFVCFAVRKRRRGRSRRRRRRRRRMRRRRSRNRSRRRRRRRRRRFVHTTTFVACMRSSARLPLGAMSRRGLTPTEVSDDPAGWPAQFNSQRL